MSKWRNDFINQFKDTATVRRLTNDIKNAIDKDKRQKEIDKKISEVIKGKWKRRNY